MKGQPIETAPKTERVRILGWSKAEGFNTVERDRDGDWIQISDSGRATCFNPTHWFPFPDPPC